MSRSKAPQQSLVIVVAGFAGVGKSTLCQAAVREIAELRKLVSVTTRAPRIGEVEGVDKYFLSDIAFEAQLQQGRLTIPSEVYGNRYAIRASDLSSAEVLITEMNHANLPAFRARHARTSSICVLPKSAGMAISQIGQRGETDLEIATRSSVGLREYAEVLELVGAGAFDRTFSNNFDLASQRAFVELVEELIASNNP